MLRKNLKGTVFSLAGIFLLSGESRIVSLPLPLLLLRCLPIVKELLLRMAATLAVAASIGTISNASLVQPSYG